MSTWKETKAWSDRFISDIKMVLGGVFICEAPEEEDACRNTDLVVMRIESIRVACRMRRHRHLQYLNEFTIRTSRPSGAKTELAKVIEGWGDYLFYGFQDNDGGLGHWRIGDLKVFRLWLMRAIASGGGLIPGAEMENHDHSSSFRVFGWSQLPHHFLIAEGFGLESNTNILS